MLYLLVHFLLSISQPSSYSGLSSWLCNTPCCPGPCTEKHPTLGLILCCHHLEILKIVAHRLSCPMALWDLPGPGIEPVPCALAGGFLSIVPGKSLFLCFLVWCFLLINIFLWNSRRVYSYATLFFWLRLRKAQSSSDKAWPVLHCSSKCWSTHSSDKGWSTSSSDKDW